MKYNFLLISILITSFQAMAQTPTCESSYKSASQSASTGDVMAAIDVCKKDLDFSCTEYVTANSDGANTGDGRFVAAACRLLAAHGANKKVRNGSALKRCEDAKIKALKQSSVAEVAAAADLCEKDTTKTCAKNSDGTGDGRLVTAVCMLNAAYGAYKVVSSQPLSVDHSRPADFGAPTPAGQ